MEAGYAERRRQELRPSDSRLRGLPRAIWDRAHRSQVAPIVLWEFAQLLEGDNFERLCARLTFRTTVQAHMAVGIQASHLVYGETDAHPGPRSVDETSAWLGVRVQPELRHIE